MQSTPDCIAPQQPHLRDVAMLAAEIKRLLMCHGTILREEGIRKEMRQLEEWLETERKGTAPVSIISKSGASWLVNLRNTLKLSAEEAQRLEGEGGHPSSRDQTQKIEDLLGVVRRIDEIIVRNSEQPT